MGKRIADRFRAGLPVSFLLTMYLFVAGCGGSQAEWNSAYKANFDVAYQAASAEERTRGGPTGEKQGVEAAREDAKTGRAWQLYSSLACWALFAGVLVGITIQYTVLFVHSAQGHLPGPLTFAFVPAVRWSLSYSIFERRFRLKVDFEDKLDQILVARDLQAAQVRAAHELVKRKIAAASNLEEMAQSRLLELANKEFSKIATDAQRTAHIQSAERGDVKPPKCVHPCPYCGRRIQFPRKVANTNIKCPYHDCGRAITLPALQ